MRVLIQNCLTNKYLSPHRRWVNDPSHAENFIKTLRAWSEIDEQNLTGVRIILEPGGASAPVEVANVCRDSHLPRPRQSPLHRSHAS